MPITIPPSLQIIALAVTAITGVFVINGALSFVWQCVTLTALAAIAWYYWTHAEMIAITCMLIVTAMIVKWAWSGIFLVILLFMFMEIRRNRKRVS